MIQEEKFLKKEEIYKQRKMERDFHKRRCEETKKSIDETKKEKINIRTIIFDLLEELGFDRKALGTKYLEDVIETLYHERKVFDENNNFFNLNDRRNNHYSFTKEYYECSLNNIRENIDEEVSKSYVNESSLNDIVYSVVNDVICQYDKFGKILVYNIENNNYYKN